MQYSSIPTFYNGVQFRSRLEARWAAFFDLIGWEWEYEPIDLQGWIPDFRIKGYYHPILVEVKPFDKEEDWSEEIEIIEKSLGGLHKDSPELLLLGTTIFKDARIFSPDNPYIGWFGELSGSTLDGMVYWFQEACIGKIHGWDYGSPIGLTPSYGGYYDRITGESEDCACTMPYEAINSFWKEAGNLVQWKNHRKFY